MGKKMKGPRLLLHRLRRLLRHFHFYRVMELDKYLKHHELKQHLGHTKNDKVSLTLGQWQRTVMNPEDTGQLKPARDSLLCRGSC